MLLPIWLTGCHESGTWAEDPGNFERVFGFAKPDDVVVVHSWFWRSPHFTYEAAYFIQIQRNDDFQKRLFGGAQYRKIDSEAEKARALDGLSHRLSWFVPKPIEQYDIWVPAGWGLGALRVFVDRETGDIFLSDQQL